MIAIYKLHAGRLIVLWLVAVLMIGLVGEYYRETDAALDQVMHFQHFEEEDSLRIAVTYGAADDARSLADASASALKLARTQRAEVEGRRNFAQDLFMFGGFAILVLMGLLTWIWASPAGAAYRHRETSSR